MGPKRCPARTRRANALPLTQKTTRGSNPYNTGQSSSGRLVTNKRLREEQPLFKACDNGTLIWIFCAEAFTLGSSGLNLD